MGAQGEEDRIKTCPPYARWMHLDRRTAVVWIRRGRNADPRILFRPTSAISIYPFTMKTIGRGASAIAWLTSLLQSPFFESSRGAPLQALFANYASQPLNIDPLSIIDIFRRLDQDAVLHYFLCTPCFSSFPFSCPGGFSPSLTPSIARSTTARRSSYEEDLGLLYFRTRA